MQDKPNIKEYSMLMVLREYSSLRYSNFYDHIDDLNDKYWNIHGMKISMRKVIKHQKNIVLDGKLNNIYNYNPHVEFDNNVLHELEQLQESELRTKLRQLEHAEQH